MEEAIKGKMDQLDKLSRTDAVYQRMMRKCITMERAFEDFTSDLTEKQQDLVWGFLMLCEDMSSRKLEIACEHMEFVPRVIAFRKK